MKSFLYCLLVTATLFLIATWCWSDGHDKGYNKGYDEGYDKGFKIGWYSGHNAYEEFNIRDPENNELVVDEYKCYDPVSCKTIIRRVTRKGPIIISVHEEEE